MLADVTPETVGELATRRRAIPGDTSTGEPVRCATPIAGAPRNPRAPPLCVGGRQEARLYTAARVRHAQRLPQGADVLDLRRAGRLARAPRLDVVLLRMLRGIAPLSSIALSIFSRPNTRWTTLIGCNRFGYNSLSRASDFDISTPGHPASTSVSPRHISLTLRGFHDQADFSA